MTYCTCTGVVIAILAVVAAVLLIAVIVLMAIVVVLLKRQKWRSQPDTDNSVSASHTVMKIGAVVGS